MARILVNSEWYDSIGSTSHYETEFESVILENAAVLFPEYIAVPFKRTVQSEHGARQPDFALIERNYRVWWVVEVELGHHSSRHVEDQVAVFATGDYGADDALFLCEQASMLNLPKLNQVMKGAPPRVLVVVDTPKPEWQSRLSKWGASITIVETYRSDRNRWLLRMNGAYPNAPLDVLTVCRPDPLLPRLVLVDSPANLPSHVSPLQIRYQGGLTEWETIQARDRVWLSPIKTNPLPPGSKFALTRSEHGILSFEPYER